MVLKTERRNRGLFREGPGFTLIELLVVCSIILILVSISMPNYMESMTRAKVVRVTADMRALSVAMTSYSLDFKYYPPDHHPSIFRPDLKGLNQLTTPIVYIDAVPYDIFNPPNSGMNTTEASFGLASTGKTIAQMMLQGERPKVQAFAIFSHGPSLLTRFYGLEEWPCHAGNDPCPNKVGFLRYSPTNGTKSAGEILQLGGESRSGNYCIDRQIPVRGFNPPGC